MSRHALLFGGSLRVNCTGTSAVRRAAAAAAALHEFRRFAHAAVVQEERTVPPPTFGSPSRQDDFEPRERRQQREEAWVDQTGWSPDPTRRRPTDGRREEYFSRLFGPLKFPPQLAHRTLTHNSHSMARQGHNAALAFIGRRVMAAYFMMFLHSSRKLKFTADVEDIAARSLNTHLLGEYVGNAWGVGRELVWAPSISEHLKAEGHLPGLYKVQGETVQAIMGAIYHQFGGVVAHRVFHLRLLPLVLVPGGMPEEFHKDAVRIFHRLGGKHGRLIPDGEKDSQKREAPAL